MWKALVIVAALTAVAPALAADETTVTVELKDGSRLVGTLLADDARHVRVRTRTGLELEFARAEVAAVRRDGAPAAAGDIDASRLLFSPTARPLRKGEGYFSDIELFLPGVAVGITDHLSLAGGMSVVPTIGLADQAFYLAPKLGFQLSPRTALAAGLLYAGVPGDDDLGDFGLAYGVATLGRPEKSLTLGAGVAAAGFGEGPDPTPILMVGGAVTLSPRIALVSENWIVLADGVELGEQPIGLAVRFLGDRLSADVGFVTVPAALADGAIVPWVSVSYRFGRGSAEPRPATKPLAQAHWKLKPPMRPSTSHSSPQM